MKLDGQEYKYPDARLIVGSYYRPRNYDVEALAGLADSLSRITSKCPSANNVLAGAGIYI